MNAPSRKTARRLPLVFGLLAAAALSAGCAGTSIQRDAQGNPLVQRADPQSMAGPTERRPLSAEDLVALSRQGIAPDEINRRYAQSGARLRLSPQQGAELRQRGVDQRVIDHVLTHEIEAQRTDRITAEVDQAQRSQPRVITRSSPWGPAWNSYWSPRFAPYGGYGWWPGRSGWYGGVGIGF